MKKYLSLILACILLIFSFSLPRLSASAEDSNEEGGATEAAEETGGDFSADAFLENFVTTCPKRLSGTEGEKNAAALIAKEFKFLSDNYGYVPYETEDGSKFFQRFSFVDSEKNYNSQNVIVTKQAAAPTKKTVIIGAHYDNAYLVPSGVEEKDYLLQGAYDNGTGVAVMLDLAYKLKDVDLDFNVKFIAFGGEEYLCKGSDYFAKMLSDEELKNILIMFNLDVIGAGEKLYLYCDEVKTEHETFLLNSAQKLKIEVNSPPLDKHVEVYSVNDMPYSHIGFMSDNLSFLTRGVNCAFFFTYNWEYGLSESANNPTIIHQSGDNMETLKTLYKDTYKIFMSEVSNIIYESLISDNFEQTMVSSLENKFNYRVFFSKTIIAIIGITILTAAAILIIFVYSSLNKNKNKPLPEIINSELPKEDDLSVFGKEFEGK